VLYERRIIKNKVVKLKYNIKLTKYIYIPILLGQVVLADGIVPEETVMPPMTRIEQRKSPEPKFVLGEMFESKVQTLAGGEEPDLSEKAKKGVALTQQWQGAKAKNPQAPIMLGDNGRVLYNFGRTQPEIVCAVLNLCDIALQKGEEVDSVNIGDTTRWKLIPAKSGKEGVKTPHIIVSPKEVGISTSMVITTNRRTYHLKLTSSSKHYMAQIGFNYTNDPKDKKEEWNKFYQENKKKKPKRIIKPTKGADIEKLDFAYETVGKGLFAPLKNGIYNNGVKTIIRMPEEMKYSEAPLLLVLNGDREEIIKYRLRNNQFEIDGLPSSIVLLWDAEDEKIFINKKKI
jgi:type IV secretion system protein VirB9